MKKTIISVAALVVAGALLTGCAPDTAAREAQEPIPKSTVSDAPQEITSNTVESVSVAEIATADGPSLMVTVQMTTRDPVTADAFRQAVAESLAQASSAPSQVGLLFVQGEAFVDAQAAADEVIPGAEFSSGGPILTGDQARAIVG